MKPPARIRVDWFRAIVQLEGAGYKPHAIGAAIDVPRRTIVGWRNYGAEPAHAEGERLVQLWCQVMQLNRDEMPLRMDDVLSVAKIKAQHA